MVYIVLTVCLAAKIIAEAVLTDASITSAAAEIIAGSVALIMS